MRKHDQPITLETLVYLFGVFQDLICLDSKDIQRHCVKSGSPSAKEVWAVPQFQSCKHQSLDLPMSQEIRLPRWQQRRRLKLVHSTRSAVDLGLRSCHHHTLGCPKWPWIYLLRWLRRRSLKSKYAGHFAVGLEHANCSHHQLHRPM